MYRDYLESGNRANRPPLEISSNVDGEVNLDPGALNWTEEANSIRAIQGSIGNTALTREMVELERDDIRKAFLGDVFNQLTNLQGDRRTTLEISERLNEGLRRLSNPIGRLLYEILTPLLTRVAMLMIRNGMYPQPPEELQGRSFKVEYSSPLILALKRHQSNAFMQWAAFVAEMETIFPGAKDNVNSDKAIRDMADAFGVDYSHKMPLDRREEIRDARAQQMAQQQAMEAAQAASSAYAQTTKAPDPGSAAGQLQEAMSG